MTVCMVEYLKLTLSGDRGYTDHFHISNAEINLEYDKFILSFIFNFNFTVFN